MGDAGLKEKAATGPAGAVTTSVLVAGSEAPLGSATRLTVKRPGEEYVWTGLRWSEIPPSPNSQLQLVGLFVEASVNRTSCPTVGLVGWNVKAAKGGGSVPASP